MRDGVAAVDNSAAGKHLLKEPVVGRNGGDGAVDARAIEREMEWISGGGR